jgi:protein TonB
LSSLRSFLQGLLEVRPNKIIFIKPAPARSYADVIAAADEIVGAGAELAILIDEVAVPSGIPRETPKPPVITSAEVGGVPGGVPGGVRDGIPERSVVAKSGRALQTSATHRVQPTTPPLAKAAKVSGTVIVEIAVDEEGNVFAARQISGHPLLVDAALRAARQWKFEPTIMSGVPVRVIGPLSFIFR